MTPMLRVAAFMALFLATIAYALGRGGRPERTAATIMAVGLLLTWVATSRIHGRFHGPELSVALADTLMLAGFVWLMLKADRFWPVWMAAFQAVIVLIHGAMILKPFTSPTYYKNMTQLWSYLQLALLIIGTLRYRLRTQPSRFEARLGRGALTVWRLVGRDRAAAVARGPAAPDRPRL